MQCLTTCPALPLTAMRCRVEAAQTGRLNQQQRALEQAVAELRAAEGDLRRLVGDKPSHADVAQLLAAQAAPATLQVGGRSVTVLSTLFADDSLLGLPAWGKPHTVSGGSSCWQRKPDHPICWGFWGEAPSAVYTSSSTDHLWVSHVLAAG